MSTPQLVEGRRVTISVTQEHIDRGVRCRSAECPISLAVKSALGLAALVGIESILISCGEGGDCEVPTPQDANRWRKDFDDRKRVKPFEFELVLPT